MPDKKQPDDQQIELDFSTKKDTITIRYTFADSRFFAQLRPKVEEDVRKVLGSSESIEKSELTPEMIERLNLMLGMRDLMARFGKGEIDIVSAPKDVSGEYYADYR